LAVDEVSVGVVPPITMYATSEIAQMIPVYGRKRLNPSICTL
jgi:hypothetical protein